MNMLKGDNIIQRDAIFSKATFRCNFFLLKDLAKLLVMVLREYDEVEPIILSGELYLHVNFPSFVSCFQRNSPINEENMML